mmetsp:Transcript_3137/g.10455  ORF Transcript_3137/g.10455 Transcript_3137/m.10455 type:complete len:234 (-) Transcript_3137:62-763(-)
MIRLRPRISFLGQKILQRVRRPRSRGEPGLLRSLVDFRGAMFGHDRDFVVVVARDLDSRRRAHSGRGLGFRHRRARRRRRRARSLWHSPGAALAPGVPLGTLGRAPRLRRGRLISALAVKLCPKRVRRRVAVVVAVALAEQAFYFFFRFRLRFRRLHASLRRLRFAFSAFTRDIPAFLRVSCPLIMKPIVHLIIRETASLGHVVFLFLRRVRALGLPKLLHDRPLLLAVHPPP